MVVNIYFQLPRVRKHHVFSQKQTFCRPLGPHHISTILCHHERKFLKIQNRIFCKRQNIQKQVRTTTPLLDLRRGTLLSQLVRCLDEGLITLDSTLNPNPLDVVLSLDYYPNLVLFLNNIMKVANRKNKQRFQILSSLFFSGILNHTFFTKIICSDCFESIFQ